ncbi:MAG: hypothetical protein ACXVDA_13950, partial [Ktedonobacterales bacterium]
AEPGRSVTHGRPGVGVGEGAIVDCGVDVLVVALDAQPGSITATAVSEQKSRAREDIRNRIQPLLDGRAV